MKLFLLNLILFLSIADQSFAKTSAAFMRGVTVSCPRAGAIWGSPEMDTSLDKIKKIGANWVAIHPYGRVARNGQVTYDSKMLAPGGYLDRAAVKAKNQGVKLFIKPHLGYWGSFSWRGDIGFGDNEKNWNRFFETYSKFIIELAKYSERVKAPLFSIGLEYKKTTHRKEWLLILTKIRKVYNGKLTYSANWDHVDKVPFWNKLDLIGVQAYFPLDQKNIQKSWKDIFKKLKALSSRVGGRSIVFTEIGYDRSPSAAKYPWKSAEVGVNKSKSIPLRTTLVQEVLKLEGHYPTLAGVFWWKWMPGDVIDKSQVFGKYRVNDGDFSVRDLEVAQALTRYWKKSKTLPKP